MLRLMLTAVLPPSPHLPGVLATGPLLSRNKTKRDRHASPPLLNCHGTDRAHGQQFHAKLENANIFAGSVSLIAGREESREGALDQEGRRGAREGGEGIEDEYL